MGTMKRFLIFSVLSAFIVGVLSAVAVMLITALEQRYSVIVEGGLIVTPYAGTFGLIAGVLGFWIMWFFRKLPETKFKTCSVVVGVLLGITTLALFLGPTPILSSGWKMILFPVLPFIIAVFLFTKMAEKYVRQ
jgi:membrane associated rhomboid family serine protease